MAYLDSHSLCEYCQRIRIDSIISTGPIDPRAGLSQGGLSHQPTLDALQKSSRSCQLCAFFNSALERSNAGEPVAHEYSVRQGSFIRLIAGATAFSNLSTPKGLFHMLIWSRWSNFAKPAYLSITTEPDDPLALAGDVVGRQVAENCEPVGCAHQIIKWLSNCENEHQNCRNPLVISDKTPSRLRNSQDLENSLHQSPLPPRLIDVGGASSAVLQLKETDGLYGRYCALSYSWGRSKSFRTHKVTYKDRICGFRPEDLPTTIRDAVHLTQNLGFQYLWVDALCIVQDDRDDWAKNSAIMDEIYGFATLTIAASMCEDKWQPLFRKRAQAESIQISSPCSNDSSKRGTMTLSQSDGHFEDVVKKSVLARRAWTLQESALSLRVVYFTRERLFWECQQCILAEDGSIFDKSQSSRIFLPPLDRKPTLELKLVRWQSIVDDYARRKLFAASDKLPALAGLARQFHRLTSATYIAGLWREGLPLDLLWTINAELITETSQGPKSWKAPSWSWASVEGAVHSDGYQTMVLTSSAGPPVEQLEILDIDISPREVANPFGELTRANLHVRGKTQRLSRALERRRPHSKRGRLTRISQYYATDPPGGEITFDDAAEGAVVPINFLCLLVDRRKSDSGHYTSVFIAIEEVEHGHFKRLGAGYIDGDSFFASQRLQELTLV
ncbi:uncharacterized protein PV07_03804 [Cladophialophora immunda]|uniref:Heterokaryon incompatibility domain-containing protein n=1 Tax=Cladophialophora immunda TaxID=569365 RepID=A0A0D2D936_9EURO|nr:uncharacterized protein PV07_03804 [Cladophialophora immunda]KIW32244.1 hypothetical protein PV07_03804 [Cladophialophora immunda]